MTTHIIIVDTLREAQIARNAIMGCDYPPNDCWFGPAERGANSEAISINTNEALPNGPEGYRRVAEAALERARDDGS